MERAGQGPPGGGAGESREGWWLCAVPSRADEPLTQKTSLRLSRSFSFCHEHRYPVSRCLFKAGGFGEESNRTYLISLEGVHLGRIFRLSRGWVHVQAFL